ncbi:MAG: alpha/beta hydrolase [Gemmataceae bacterium]|nr:alpha/beta hydrolase [Gemmataceae bacterium]
MLTRLLPAALALAALSPPAAAQPAKTDAPPDAFTRKDDVIYGRKHGLALTLDVFTPKDKANGRGVILCVSGGWYSAKDLLSNLYLPTFVRPLTARGYTVFAVLHGSQPLFTIPEAAEDIDNAVKFVKQHAKEYGVDPDKLGVAGMSAGGHLSLMQGTAAGDGKVAAVGCFFPPTDFLNYGKEKADGGGTGELKDFAAPFAFRKYDPKARAFAPVDAEERAKIIKRISPATRVGKESAPALVIHGDADKLVPIQQAELLVDKYKEAGVPFELVVRKDKAHGWPGMDKDVGLIADWFDKHLGVAK